MRRTTAISIFILALLALSLWSRTASRIVALLTVLFILFLCVYQIVSAIHDGHTASYQGVPDALKRFLEDEDETQFRLPFLGKSVRPAKKSESERKGPR